MDGSRREPTFSLRKILYTREEKRQANASGYYQDAALRRHHHRRPPCGPAPDFRLVLDRQYSGQLVRFAEDVYVMPEDYDSPGLTGTTLSEVPV